jgi:hypothetical protein
MAGSPAASACAPSFSKRKAMNEIFRKLAHKASEATGTAWALILAAGVILVWALTGPLFGFSNTWQLVINTGTTVLTFLMVFLSRSAFPAIRPRGNNRDNDEWRVHGDRMDGRERDDGERMGRRERMDGRNQLDVAPYCTDPRSWRPARLGPLRKEGMIGAVGVRKSTNGQARPQPSWMARRQKRTAPLICLGATTIREANLC